MKLSLDLRTSLTQTLTPQQIQYLKLLQLPVVQLEQQMRTEIEQNPMLDELGPNDELDEVEDNYDDRLIHDDDESKPEKSEVDDVGDPFEFYKLLWQDDSDTGHDKNKSTISDDNDDEPFQINDNVSMMEE